MKKFGEKELGKEGGKEVKEEWWRDQGKYCFWRSFMDDFFLMWWYYRLLEGK